jgi:acyl-CoA thioesterase
MLPPMFEFDTDTAVQRTGEDSFRAEITDRWNTLAGPNGGYVLAIAARALGERLPMPHPITITGHFLRPATAGPTEIRTALIKSGKRHATGTATVSQGGKDVLTTVATFADLNATKGRTLILNEPPELPPADSLPDPITQLPPEWLPSIARRVDVRVEKMPGFLRGEPSGKPATDLWVRFADGREQDPLSLVFLVDGASFPVIAEIGEFMSSTVELTVHVRALPSPGWLACRISTRHVEGGYAEEDFEVWDSADTLVAQSRQLILIGG